MAHASPAIATDLRMAAPFLRGLPGFLRHPLTQEEARRILGGRLALPARAMPLFWTVLTSAGEVSGPMPEAWFFDSRFVDTFDTWVPP